MRKILFLLAFVLMSGTAFSQAAFLTDGVTINIKPGYISGDSIHTVGLVDMRQGTNKRDSLSIIVNTSDSLRYTLYVVPVLPKGTWNVADSVAGCITPNNALYYVQHAAEGVSVVPWFKIAGAIGANSYCDIFRVYIRVWAVGSEVASSGKTANIQAVVSE